MTRRCSHCSNNGHNSRTCPAARAAAGSGSGGVMLFGVRLTEGMGSMKKSASMGSIPSSSSHYSPSSPPPTTNPGSPGSDPARDHARSGYASDDPTHASCCSANCRIDRKKGTPWTEEEHRMFLLGLQKLGKGDWRGIARNFVASRTPTQVASHAQKYFLRQAHSSRKRRSSLFDIIPEMETDHPHVLNEQLMLRSPPGEPENTNHMSSLLLGQDMEPEPASESPSNNHTLELERLPYSNIPLPPGRTCYPAFVPVPYPFWPATPAPASNQSTIEFHQVLKPTPLLPKEPRSVDEVARMSKLSIGEGMATRMEPSALSHKLMEASTSRQSAFHVNPTVNGADLSPRNRSPIHAV